MYSLKLFRRVYSLSIAGYRYALPSFFFIFIHYMAQGQKIQMNSETLIERANFYYEEGAYNRALKLYQKADSIYPAQYFTKYRIGACIFRSHQQKTNSIPFLEEAVKAFENKEVTLNIKIPSDVFLYLAKAYHAEYRIDEAINTANEFKRYTNDAQQLSEADRLIKMCNTASELIKSPVNIIIEPVGNEINSPYPDYSPVVSADESVMIFTSRRPGSTGNKTDDNKQFFEDIYISTRINGVWQKPSSIGSNINTSGHEASISLTPDAEHLFIYRDDNGDGNIYLCNKNGDRFDAPVKMDDQIDSKNWEPSACLSPDERTLYFVSNRKGGFGGRDIYMCRLLPTGKWGKPQNLGPQINTEFDEDAPFLQGDGKTLYFSSNGHNTMGGFDIFSSTLINDNWSEPRNIGYPINTTEDDLFYQPTPDGKRAYFASVRKNGLGDKDIYLMRYPDAREVPLAMVKGTFYLPDSLGLKPASITVTDKETGEIIGIYNPNKKSGKYLMLLPADKKYNITATYGDQKIYTDTISVLTNGKYTEITKDISQKNTEPLQQKKINELKKSDYPKKNEPKKTDTNSGKVYRLYYEPNKFSLRKNHKTKLDSVYQGILNLPETRITIEGYTDSISTASYNFLISSLRAQEASKYFLRLGIPEDHIKTEAYGETKPEFDNGTYNGRKKNRCVIIRTTE